jgi:hypothetical protein
MAGTEATNTAGNIIAVGDDFHLSPAEREAASLAASLY